MSDPKPSERDRELAEAVNNKWWGDGVRAIHIVDDIAEACAKARAEERAAILEAVADEARLWAESRPVCRRIMDLIEARGESDA